MRSYHPLNISINTHLAKLSYLLLLSVALLAGCQTVPDTKEIIENANPQNQDLEIKGIEENYSTERVDKTLNKLAETEEDVALLEKAAKNYAGHY